jgi:hypothetical protein
MYEAAASCKDIALATVTNWEPHGVTLAGYCYAVRHGMKVQLITPYRVSHLQRYGVRVRGNVTSVYPPYRPRRPRGAVGVQLYSFFNLGARCGWMVNATPRPLYRRERPGTHCIGNWVGPRAGRTGVENLAPTGIRSPDRPARSESLY